MRSTKILRLCCAVFLAGLLTPLLAITNISGAESTQNLLQLINQQRSVAGLNQLTYNNKLSASAFAKAQNMCTEDYWAHTAPSGLTPWSFIDNSGYQYVSAAENLAEGYSSDTRTVTAWMDSPGHRKNILNGKFADFGAGYITCELQGKQTTIIVTHFGTSKESLTTASNYEQQKPVEPKTESKPVLVTEALGSSVTAKPKPTAQSVPSTSVAKDLLAEEKGKTDITNLFELLIKELYSSNTRLFILTS